MAITWLRISTSSDIGIDQIEKLCYDLGCIGTSTRIQNNFPPVLNSGFLDRDLCSVIQLLSEVVGDENVQII